MTDEFKKQLQKIFETEEYNTELYEEEEPTNDFIHTGADGISYSIKVEPDENEFNVFDKSGKQIDIFVPSMVDMDGGLTKDKRKEIMDDYNQNHSKEEPMAENKEVINKFEKQYGDKHGKEVYYATANKEKRNPETFKKLEEEPVLDEAAAKGKESHGGAKHGEGHFGKNEVKSKAAKVAHRQEAQKEIKKEMIDEEKEKLSEGDPSAMTPEEKLDEEKWMQDAVHHKGRFTSYCKKEGFEGPCKECAEKALKSDDASVRGMASFYMNSQK